MIKPHIIKYNTSADIGKHLRDFIKTRYDSLLKDGYELLVFKINSCDKNKSLVIDFSSDIPSMLVDRVEVVFEFEKEIENQEVVV